MKVLGALLWGNLENIGPNTPIHGKVHIKLMQSLQLNISHQTTPYSSIWGIEKIWAVWTQIPQFKVRELYTESHCRCLTQLFMLNEALLKCKPSEGRVIPVLVYLNLSKSRKKNKKRGMDTQKLIHSVKIHILHQTKPYSRIKTNWEPSYTCVSMF